MAYTLRLAQPADAEAVTQLVREAYEHYIPRMGCEPMPMREDYAALIAQGLVQVLDEAGRLDGILVLIEQEEAMLLDNIAVSRHKTGHGLGRLLLQAAEQQARARGYELIRLYTHVTMGENIALYQRYGYDETHRGWFNGLHRVYLQKQLSTGMIGDR